MPCGDITEQLLIELDASDALRTYTLRKRTCGTAIGTESLLLPWLVGMASADILAQNFAAMRDAFENISEDMEFVYAKHLEAMQEGLRTLAGVGDDRCVALAVAASDAGICFEALVRISDPTAPVASCGGCGRCGSKGKRAAKAANPAAISEGTAP
jgi:hypothetical protein